MSKKWEDWEIDILYNHYPDKIKIQKMLPLRSKKSIDMKCFKLDLVRYRYWLKSDDQYILQNWETMSDLEMSQVLNRSECAIKVRRGKLNVLRRDENNRIFTFNYNVFTDYLKSPDEAVLLGFIYADGSINARKTKLTIDLHSRDEAYLLKIKDFLEYTGELKYGKNRPSTRIEVNGKDFIKRLHHFGVYNNKSLTLSYPKADILGDFEIDFIRGYFEGDGSVYIVKDGRVGVKFTGTKDVMKSIMDYFHKHHQIEPKTISKDKNIYSFSYGKQSDVCNVGRIMYKSYFDSNSQIFMKRKLDKFYKIWEMIGL